MGSFLVTMSILKTSVVLVSVVTFALEDDGCSMASFTAGGPAKKYLMTEAAASKGAMCLDGTPGAYYFQPGTGSGATKWYIHHQGGGWCESLDDCLGRSRGGLGSSNG